MVVVLALPLPPPLPLPLPPVLLLPLPPVLRLPLPFPLPPALPLPLPPALPLPLPPALPLGRSLNVRDLRRLTLQRLLQAAAAGRRALLTTSPWRRNRPGSGSVRRRLLLRLWQ